MTAATRLDTGADDPGTALQQYLRLALRSDSYAVTISEVREILEVGRITPLPGTPDFVRGVLNLRGVVVPIIDLAARFGQGTSEVGRRSCIVVVDVQGDDDRRQHTLGLLVDAVYEVFDVAGALEHVPVLGTAIAAEFLAGIARAHGRVVPVIELRASFDPDTLADLIAQPTPA